MTTMEEIRELLENRSLNSARDIEEFEENVMDDKAEEVRLVCDPLVGKVRNGDNILLGSLRFLKAWNSLGREIKIKDGNAFPLGQGDTLDIDTGVSVSLPDGAVGMVALLPGFIGSSGLTLVGSPLVHSSDDNIIIRVTNIRKDLAIVEKDKDLAELILVAKMKIDILKVFKKYVWI